MSAAVPALCSLSSLTDSASASGTALRVEGSTGEPAADIDMLVCAADAASSAGLSLSRTNGGAERSRPAVACGWRTTTACTDPVARPPAKDAAHVAAPITQGGARTLETGAPTAPLPATSAPAVACVGPGGEQGSGCASPAGLGGGQQHPDAGGVAQNQSPHSGQGGARDGITCASPNGCRGDSPQTGQVGSRLTGAPHDKGPLSSPQQLTLELHTFEGVRQVRPSPWPSTKRKGRGEGGRGQAGRKGPVAVLQPAPPRACCRLERLLLCDVAPSPAPRHPASWFALLFCARDQVLTAHPLAMKTA